MDREDFTKKINAFQMSQITWKIEEFLNSKKNISIRKMSLKINRFFELSQRKRNRSKVNHKITRSKMNHKIQ